MEGFMDVKALAELLCPKEDEVKFDDEQKVKPYSKKKDPVKRKIVKEEKPKEQRKIDEDDFLEQNSEINDWRKTPEWNITYKQQVTPSDLYLQMSGKTQLTSSCEDMIITVELPGEQGKSIDVKVSQTRLDLLSPLYRLSVPLPHAVDPQKANEAKWYPEEEQLKLTLRMEREFDYINF